MATFVGATSGEVSGVPCSVTVTKNVTVTFFVTVSFAGTFSLLPTRLIR
jgi:hypothetical protein